MVLERLSLMALGRRQCLGLKALAGSFYLKRDFRVRACQWAPMFGCPFELDAQRT